MWKPKCFWDTIELNVSVDARVVLGECAKDLYLEMSKSLLNSYMFYSTVAEVVTPWTAILQTLGSIPQMGLFIYKLKSVLFALYPFMWKAQVFLGYYRIKCFYGCPSCAWRMCKRPLLRNK